MALSQNERDWAIKAGVLRPTTQGERDMAASGAAARKAKRTDPKTGKRRRQQVVVSKKRLAVGGIEIFRQEIFGGPSGTIGDIPTTTRGGGTRTRTRYVYDTAAAKALARTEWLKHLGLYGAEKAKLEKSFRIPRTGLGFRKQQRFARGAERTTGLAGRKRRESLRKGALYKAYISQGKAGLQRYKSQIESYRSKWGL